MNDLLPAALAIAASPFPLIPAILLLFSPRARVTSTSFLLGWFVGVALPTVVFVLASDLVEGSDYTPRWVSWTRLVLGAALVAFGVRQWLTRKAQTDEPAWMRGLADATPGSALRLGLILSAANPKILLLAAAGAVSIATDHRGFAIEAALILGFSLVASISVAVPVCAYLVLGERALAPLGKVRDWLQVNNAALMAVVMVVIGCVVGVKGLTGL